MLRVIGCVVGAIVIILLYEMIGIFAAYKKQPELSEETKQRLHPEDIYTDANIKTYSRANAVDKNIKLMAEYREYARELENRYSRVNSEQRPSIGDINS